MSHFTGRYYAKTSYQGTSLLDTQEITWHNTGAKQAICKWLCHGTKWYQRSCGSGRDNAMQQGTAKKLEIKKIRVTVTRV